MADDCDCVTKPRDQEITNAVEILEQKESILTPQLVARQQTQGAQGTDTEPVVNLKLIRFSFMFELYCTFCRAIYYII